MTSLKNRHCLGYTSSMRYDENQINLQTSSQSCSESLMLAYAKGEHKAFDELYSRHKDPLYRFILRQGIAASKADELFQEIWMKVIKARNNYQTSARFETWFYRIARNHLIDDFRKYGQDDLSEFDEQLHPKSIEDGATMTVQSPEAIVDVESKKSRLLAMVTALPFLQREAFLLKHEAGLSNQDISLITHASTEAIKSRIRYAMNQLKSQLGGP